MERFNEIFRKNITTQRLERVLMTCSTSNSASYRAIMGLMGLYGGEQLSDVVVGEHNEHRVWVNTRKGK